MIRQTVVPFTLERTDETLTAHGGLALLAEYTHALGRRALVARYLPRPGRNRGYAPSVPSTWLRTGFVETVVLLLQAGGRTLEDLRELEREATRAGGPPRRFLPLARHAGHRFVKPP